MRRTLGLLAALLLTLGFAACGDDDDDVDATATTTTADDDAAETTTTEAAEAPAGDATVAVADSSLGPILVDAEGNTLYLFTRDTEDASACTEGCLEAWPPLMVDGEPVAGDGVDASLLGTDGADQVTYNGHRLYHYAADASPGDTTGHGVGDAWFAVTPEGEAAE